VQLIFKHMATKDLSSYDPESVPSAKDMRFGIVVSDWNHEVTWSLLNGATNTLLKYGVSPDDIIVKHVPGSFELGHSGSQSMMIWTE